MSTNEKKYVNKLVADYSVKEVTKVDELKTLDSKVKNPAYIFAYTFGVIGSLVLGFGMCVAMEVILAGMMWLGILVGLVGILMVSINYFIFDKILKSRKAKYADQILSLTNEILNNKE